MAECVEAKLPLVVSLSIATLFSVSIASLIPGKYSFSNGFN
jgi:hypothetical protein